MTVTETLAATTPIPPGRGRWRLTLHNRVFTVPGTGGNTPSVTGIGELVDARSRRLEQQWCAPAQLSFTVDGHSQAAAQIQELAQDVIAWRWDETAGRDLPMFLGVITQTQDQISEQAHTLNVVCHDYLAVMSRRYITNPIGRSYAATDQDTIASSLLSLGNGPTSGNLVGGSYLSFLPGSQTPLWILNVNPDGTTRGLSGVLRDRVYPGGQSIGEAIDALAKVQGGFDYDAWVDSTATAGASVGQRLRIFYPAQGVTRSDMALVYGSTVSAVTRSVNSANYGNYWRVLGNNGSSDPAVAQLFAETWNSDSNNVSVFPAGLWMSTANAADVSIQATLDQQAAGLLATKGILMPSYTVTMRPGAYRWGFPNMGDTVPLIVKSGRLNINTTLRVMGITYAIGDDGQENIELTVGQPAVTLAQILTDAHTDINALARR